MDNNLIYSVKDLCFSYGKLEVLTGLSFDLREGSITTLIGANGRGKSTLFNLMTKNLAPASGQIKLYGKTFPRFGGRTSQGRPRSCASTIRRRRI